MVIEVRRQAARAPVHEPAAVVLPNQTGRQVVQRGTMVRSRAAGDDVSLDPSAVADAATRLASSIGASSSMEPDGERPPFHALAKQLVPLVAWAFDAPGMADAEAVRVGVTVARTRLLLGLPRSVVLASIHELPAVVADRTTPGRLDAVATQVALRLRREPNPRRDVQPDARPR